MPEDGHLLVIRLDVNAKRCVKRIQLMLLSAQCGWNLIVGIDLGFEASPFLGVET